MNVSFKKINITIIIILILILSLSCIFLIDNIIEKREIDNQITDFKSRGVLVYQDDIYSYYRVSKKYDYEDTSNIVESYDDKFVGTTGDIYITNRNPLPSFFVTKWISRLSYIGHCGIVYSEDASKMVEIVGNKSKEENVVRIVENEWLNIDSPNYIILRSKEINDETKESIINECNNVLGCKYNYTFIFHSKKRFYCIDLVSYIYKKIGINLNKDYFFTTGSDLVENNSTYMIYYRERYIENNKVKYNVYYLQ